MFEAERLAGYIQMHKGWCESQNVRNTKFFWDKLESWKFDARWAKGQGKEVPAPPAVPTILKVDEAKATMRFWEWESGLPQTFDFYVESKLEVPPGTFDLAAAPPVQPMDPVAGKDGDIPNQFLVSPGDNHAPGEVIQHALGMLVKTRKMTPFGPVDRWVKIG